MDGGERAGGNGEWCDEDAMMRYNEL